MRQILLLLALLPACLSAADEIPLVGIDANGNEVKEYLMKDDYVQRMTTLLQSVEESTFPVLDTVKPSLSDSDRAWQLQSFTLGISLNLSIGISIFSFGISPAFTLVFSNNDQPIIP
jgi:hypothetical protein